jgi:hypothetical protein
MKVRVIGLLVVILTCQACYGQQNSLASAPSPQIAMKLQELLDSLVSEPDAVNYVALVDAGPARWKWAGQRESPTLRRRRE